MPARIVWLTVFVSLTSLACDDTPAPVVSPDRPSLVIGDLFDPDRTGTIAGTVRWQGDWPRIAPLRSIDEPLLDPPTLPAKNRPNPNAPRIDPDTLGLSSAIVFLRRVDPRRSRPWHHPAVRVDLGEQRFRVVQGSAQSNVGFVRAGDEVSFVSGEGRLHMIQGRGSAFFSLALPKPDRPRSKRLDESGVTELLSGSGYFWMRGYLHVSDHPYFARPDEQGRFALEQVPAGEYDLVTWHPSWEVKKSRRNPDLFRMQQVYYGEPIEVVQRVRVTVGERVEVKCSVGAP